MSNCASSCGPSDEMARVGQQTSLAPRSTCGPASDAPGGSTENERPRRTHHHGEKMVNQPLSTVDSLHDQLHDMLVATKRVLDEHGIPFFLGYGTALGSVRESDYIPWDLDVDLLVRWRDHDRILESLRDLPDPYVASYDASDYQYEFIRVARRDIQHEYCHLDLFPLAPTFNSPKAALLHLKVLRAIAWVPWARKRATEQWHDPLRFRRWRARGTHVALRLLPRGVSRALFNAAAKLKRTQGLFLINICGSYGSREIIRASWLEDSSRTRLRGERFDCPSPSSYLAHMYGDYMNPPDADSVQRGFDVFEAAYIPALEGKSLVLVAPQKGS